MTPKAIYTHELTNLWPSTAVRALEITVECRPLNYDLFEEALHVAYGQYWRSSDS